MKIETPDINIPDEFKMTKTAFASLIVSNVAQYGVGLMVNTLAKSLIIGGKVHQRIAIQVATWVIIWACKNSIKTAAIAATVEVINAVENVINLFRNAQSA